MRAMKIMEKNTEKVINDFIIELNESFPFINTEISEVPYDDSVLIYHNYEDADNDNDFKNVLLSLQEKYFFNEKIINVGVAYDYLLEERINNQKNLYQAVS
jgi:hypothetical protein